MQPHAAFTVQAQAQAAYPSLSRIRHTLTSPVVQGLPVNKQAWPCLASQHCTAQASLIAYSKLGSVSGAWALTMDMAGNDKVHLVGVEDGLIQFPHALQAGAQASVQAMAHMNVAGRRQVGCGNPPGFL